MSFNPELRRMIETVSFNPYNFVESYDKSIFSKQQAFKLSIDNQSVLIKIHQTTDRVLQKYSIFSLQNATNTIQLVVKSEDIDLIPALLAEGDISKKKWMSTFTKFNQSTQIIGSTVRDSIQFLAEEASFLRQEKAKIKSRELQVKACKKADKLAAKFCTKIANLDTEMAQCGLSPENIVTIKRHAAGTYDVTDFFDRLALLKLPKTATVIGLNHKEIIPGVRETLECEDYMDAYMRIFKDFRAREDFLEKLTEETHPIIFLVPHKLFGPKRGVTAGEMEWLLKNPNAMGQVHFVFRAYKTYSLKVISSTGLTGKAADSYTEYLTVRIFQQIKAKLGLPPMTFDVQAALEDWSISRRKFEILRPWPFGDELADGRLSLDEIDEFALVPLTEQMSLLSVVDVSEEVNVTEVSSCTALSLSRTTIKMLKASRAIFFIGGAGSGKGTVRDLITKEHLERRYVIIDPDAIKESMPEYQEAISKGSKSAANDVHERSVKYATQLLAQTIDKKRSFIYDSTGSRFWIYEEQMEAARQKGMFVELIYVETAVENCLMRAKQRAAKTGRFVPETTVRSSNLLARDVFSDLQPLAHRSKKYNNDGAVPELVSVIKMYA